MYGLCDGYETNADDAGEDQHAANYVTAEELAFAAEVQQTMSRRQQRRAGEWNADTVRLGGLGWNGGNTTSTTDNSVAEGNFAELERCWRELGLPATTRLKLSVKYAGPTTIPLGRQPSVEPELDDGESDTLPSVQGVALEMRRVKAHAADAVNLWQLAASGTYTLSRGALAYCVSAAVPLVLSATLKLSTHVHFCLDTTFPSAGVTTREGLLEELQTFELTASDPLRFFSPAQNSAGERLGEERRRRRLDTKLASVTNELYVTLDALCSRHQDVVPYGAVADYREKMRGDRRAIMLRLEQDRRRSGSATRAGTIGGRYPLLPPVSAGGGGRVALVKHGT